MKEKIADLEKEIGDIKAQKEDMLAQIAVLKQANEEKEREQKSQEDQLDHLNTEIAETKKRIDEINALISTRKNDL